MPRPQRLRMSMPAELKEWLEALTWLVAILGGLVAAFGFPRAAAFLRRFPEWRVKA